MLKFECENLGTNCSYIATGNTKEDVKRDAVDHAKTVHKDLLEKMSPQQINDMYETVTRMTH